MIVYKIDKHTN